MSERLYSLLHLGGFAGDLAFYASHCADASRILELGCGDGRIGVALCRGDTTMSVIQEATGDEAGDEGKLSEELPRMADSAEYVGVEKRLSFVSKARR
jgi:hypothetical protein